MVKSDTLFELLVTTALKSNMLHKHGCVITYRNKIISSGYNFYKITNNIYNYSNDIYISNLYSIHAEQDAIQKIKNKAILKYCKIFIIRLKNSNEIINNFDINPLHIEQGIPCHMCNNLINKYNLKFTPLKSYTII